MQSLKSLEDKPHVSAPGPVRDENDLTFHTETAAERIANHEVERELREAAPRRVRYTRKTQIARRWTWNLLFAALFGLYLLAASNVKFLNEVARTGVFTKAQVDDKTTRSGKSRKYYLHETFTANGQTYSIREKVRRSEYEEIPLGTLRPVTYLPSKPDIYYFGRVDTERVADRCRAWTLGILLGGLATGGIIWIWEAYLRQRRRLLRDGFAVVGVVEHRRVVEGKSTTYSITYRYPVSDGSHTNTEYVSQAAHDALEPGTPLTVLLNPAHPKTSLPYGLLTEVEVEGAATRIFPGQALPRA